MSNEPAESATKVVPGNWMFTASDASFSRAMQRRLPPKVFDAHAHIYRLADMHIEPPHFALEGPCEASCAEWQTHIERPLGAGRLSGGLLMPYIWPPCDLPQANAFLIDQLKSRPDLRGLLLVSPSLCAEQVTAWLAEPGIVGFKPYYFFSTESPTADSSIEGYAPDWMWRMADERGLLMTLHLVRKDALSNPGNQAQLRDKCTKYPNAKIILAHCGRSFHAPNALPGLRGIRDLPNVWFDTSCICESGPIIAVLKVFGAKRLLWGSDFPVSQIRGRAITLGDAFFWLSPAIPGWSDATACNPMLVGLESLRAVYEAADILDLSESDISDIFFGNVVRLLDTVKPGSIASQERNVGRPTNGRPVNRSLRP